jgi:GT2 family glycosyltransferase
MAGGSGRCVRGSQANAGGRVTAQPTISVLLMTIRPHLFMKALESIGPAAGTLSYEVVIIADFDQPHDLPPTCRWVRRERHGVVDAVNVGCAHARGEYFFIINDESYLAQGALERLYHAAQHDPRAIYAPQHQPYYKFVYYGIDFAPFPFVRQDVVRELGGLLDPAYKAFYADPDLSLRAHAKGVPIRVVEDATIYHHNGHDASKAEHLARYRAGDQATFRARWDHLGLFRDC